MDRLKEMFAGLEGARAETLPSKFWEHYNEKNVRELSTTGYDNFKRTLALNYFTWVFSNHDRQFDVLRAALPRHSVFMNRLRARFGPKHTGFTDVQSYYYNLLTNLLWSYAERHDPDRLLRRLVEPSEGTPPVLRRHGRLISQDLANSMLEYRSITGAIDIRQTRTVLELGAGYGRTAWVFLKLVPGLRYVVADIPPALYVSERYLSSQFPGEAVFRYRPFSNYEEVRTELEAARIAFLLPHQLEHLPERSVDLFVNISSLHEMRPDQIEFYFGQIDRLTRQAFYLKQWKTHQNDFDGVTIGEGDYPVRPRWKKAFWRDCAVQTYFFEALFAM
jgi:putative sugar O-methyltransferase